MPARHGAKDTTLEERGAYAGKRRQKVSLKHGDCLWRELTCMTGKRNHFSLFPLLNVCNCRTWIGFKIFDRIKVLQLKRSPYRLYFIQAYQANYIIIWDF